MSNKLRNIKDLREHALMTLERLRDREIDTAEAAATGKVCDTVLGMVKAELEYARATQQTAHVPFMCTDENGFQLENHMPEHKRLMSPE